MYYFFSLTSRPKHQLAKVKKFLLYVETYSGNTINFLKRSSKTQFSDSPVSMPNSFVGFVLTLAKGPGELWPANTTHTSCHANLGYATISIVTSRQRTVAPLWTFFMQRS